MLREFRKHLRESSNDNLEAHLLADLYRSGAPGFFSAALHGRRHADLRFDVRPRGAEPELGPEEVMVVNVIPHASDEIWYHAHLKSEIEQKTATSAEDHRSAAAESYRIETAIAKNDHLTASTTLRFRALTAGERVIALDLVPTLRVSRAAIDGQETAFIQEDKKEDAALFVVLPKPLDAGSSHELAIEYAGDKVVLKEGGGNFAVGARESWYPNLNHFHDHARYDLTFRVPKAYKLVSVGNACSHWVSDVPLAVAGFNYGDFQKRALTDPRVGAIEGYATSETPDYLAGASEIGAMGKISGSSLMDRVPADFLMLVPIYADFDGPIARLGSARIKGSTTLPVQIELPKKPRRVMVNYLHDVLEQ